ncbi:MAG TPA: UDP-2,4-diacetamido-2,4,6-trideoxy-beta-L-altropyranose hydrolase, partial [Marinagarivorans sp.]
SHYLGNGHVVRCVALAEAFKAAGYSCQFACRALRGNAIQWLREQGFNVIVLPAPALPRTLLKDDFRTWAESDPEWDAQDSWLKLKGQSFAWLVIDHYAWAAQQQQQLAAVAARILIVDDLCNRPVYGDVIVDSGARSDSDYQPWNVNAAKLLLGHRYLPLRASFQHLRANQFKPVAAPTHGLISCGATDHANHSLTLLAFFADQNLQFPLQLTCVLARNAPHLESVMAWCDTHDRVQCVIDPADMAALIDRSSFAIGTAGSGIWERCALGKPSAVFMAGADQKNNYDVLVSAGAGVSIGQDHNPFAIDFDKLRQVLHSWCDTRNPDQYRAHARSAWQLCDGGGAQRVIEALNVLRAA